MYSDAIRTIGIVVADTANLDIETLDVGIADGVIAFDITGTVSDIPADRLDDLRDKELTPAELTFTVANAA